VSPILLKTNESGQYMKPSFALETHRLEIKKIISECHATNPRIFGSVLHGDDNDISDLDLLVDPTIKMTLLDIARAQNHLEKLLGVSVDILTPNALPIKFRYIVLAEAIQL
jgi:predicted nucleotidyltransferase